MKSSSHAPPSSGTQDGRGFTLIEVVVTMAIVAILAAVAYPSYTSYVAQGNRAEGRTAVMQMLLDQERYYTQMNTYVVVNTGPGPQPLQNFSGSSRATSRYLVTASRCEALPLNQCIRITAEPQFGGGDAKVGTLFATSVGERGCTGTHPSLCWPS